MTNHIRTLHVFVLTLGSLSCAACSMREPIVHDPSTDGPVLMRLVGRDDTIVIRCGIDAPTYSIVGSDGTVLLPQMTLEELRVRRPELHNRIETLEADGAWAGMGR